MTRWIGAGTGWIFGAALAAACSSSGATPPAIAGTAGTSTLAGGGSLMEEGGGPPAQAGQGGSSAGGTPSASSGNSNGGAPAPPPGDGMGGAGCGLEAAAFCETFDAPAAHTGRAGELDIGKWSASRGEPQLPTGNGVVFGVGPATLPACRDGLPAKVFPDQDALICDSNATIKSNHLLVAVGAQNYGQNSYRIRQPFDFTARTGVVVFDAEPYMINSLIGWISVEITEDPTPIPSYSIGNPNQNNNEGAAVPRSALEVQFNNKCDSGGKPGFKVGLIDVLQNYKDTTHMAGDAPCVPAAAGQINHFELKVSQSRVEVWATEPSADGKTFGALQLIDSADVSLPFTRGYVQITTHNHAAIKYSAEPTFGADKPLDAWLARWDNVGFDGPVFSDWREYEIADSLVPGKDGWDIAGPVMSVGYTVADAAMGPSSTLHFKDVDLTGMSKARLALAAWYNTGQGAPDSFLLRYRLNGGTWHDRPLSAGEIAVLSNGHQQGAIAQVMDVPVGELVAGDNALEFVTVNVPQNYPPAVSSVDLVLSKQ